MDSATIGTGTAALVAVLVALVTAGGPIVVALVSRGSKPKPVADSPELVSVDQLHQMLEQVARLDDEAARKDRELEHITEQRDQALIRAFRAEAALDVLRGKDVP